MFAGAAMMMEEVGQFFSRRGGGGGQGNAANALPPGDAAGPCPSCGLNLLLCRPAEGTPYVACSGAPLCRKRVYFPRATLSADVSEQLCGTCRQRGGSMRKLTLRSAFTSHTCFESCKRSYQAAKQSHGIIVAQVSAAGSLCILCRLLLQSHQAGWLDVH